MADALRVKNLSKTSTRSGTFTRRKRQNPFFPVDLSKTSARSGTLDKLNLDKRYCLFLCFTAILFLVFFAIFVSVRCKKIRPAGDSFPCYCCFANRPSRMLLPRRQLCGEKALVIMSYHWSISKHRTDF